MRTQDIIAIHHHRDGFDTHAAPGAWAIVLFALVWWRLPILAAEPAREPIVAASPDSIREQTLTSNERRGPISDGQVVELLTRSWHFRPPEPALSTLDARRPWAEFTAPAKPTASFTVKLTVDLRPFEGDQGLLEIPHVLDVRLRQHDPLDRNRQNYPAFPMPDGSVPVLEATLVLHSLEHPDWKTMTIGIPLALLDTPMGTHEIVLQFTGPDWKMYVNGEMLDNDFPFGYPHWVETNEWKIDAAWVDNAAMYGPSMAPEPAPAKTPRTASSIQYWTPRGHNNWVGDVETFYHRGRYHVFYLYDRRHHQSKFGCGAHYFEHLSTTDFTTWTEHEAATPLEEQWECIGTGVPFVFNDRLCLSYGLHTTRVYPQEKTTLPAQREYLNKHGRTGAFHRSTTPGIPAGSTYSVCADGVSRFRKSDIMFHPCENPSVYTDPSGTLRMLANYGSNGIWESDSLDGGWHCISPGFPPGGDCTIYFRWGRFDYIIGGFTGLWSKPADAPIADYEDLAGQGLDVYDGLNVPSITEIPAGRFLMAGWIPIRGWGGPLVLRELVQCPDGRIGSKWMPEIIPETEAPTPLAAKITGAATFPASHESFMLVFDVQPVEPMEGRFGVTFLHESGEQAACELQVRLSDRRAQFGPGSLSEFAGRERSIREGGMPHQAGNYAIEKLMGVDHPFTVRILVTSNAKLGGALIDAEIAGQRTMITYRADLNIRKMVFRTEDVEVTNLRMAPL